MKKVLVVLAASALLLVPAASSVSAATATASGQKVVKFFDPQKKIRVAKKFKAKFVCSVDCKITALATLVYPDGGSIKVPAVRGKIAANQIAWEYVTLNGPAKDHLKATVGGARLKVIVTAKALDGTKRTQTIRHSFKFKR